MAGYFGSSMCRTWVTGDEDDEDDFYLIVDDDDLEVLESFELENAGPSRHKRRSNGFKCASMCLSALLKRLKVQTSYFKQKEDAIGRLGLSGLQKAVAAIRILAYGLPADTVDEYVRIGESTARKALHHFCQAIISVFVEYYLYALNAEDVARLLRIREQRGFPGMLGSIDCMHWEWRNCPSAYKGMFTGRGKHPSMILEVVASHDLWIWHAYFGMPGSCNDINVLQKSHVFSAYLKGQAAPVSFTVNGHTYDMCYYLADGIYPNLSAFVKTVSHPVDMKTAHFAKEQEKVHKDIDNTFGVLQSRWAIVRGPAYGWNREQIRDIMTACIIMHNMIIEDEGKLAENTNYDNVGVPATPYQTITQERVEYINKHHKLKNTAIHSQLQMDLIEHQ
nr:protein ALP1-like [Setaria viridis]